MGVMTVRRTAGNDFATRCPYVDNDSVEITLMMVFVRRFDRDPATDDLTDVSLELIGTFADRGLDKLGFREVSKPDL